MHERLRPLEGIFDDEDWYARKAAENAVERIRERPVIRPDHRA